MGCSMKKLKEFGKTELEDEFILLQKIGNPCIV